MVRGKIESASRQSQGWWRRLSRQAKANRFGAGSALPASRSPIASAFAMLLSRRTFALRDAHAKARHRQR